jgi:hypothetical protein
LSVCPIYVLSVPYTLAGGYLEPLGSAS